MSSVALGDLLSAPGVLEVVGDGGLCVGGVTSDSRRVAPGDLFAAISGEKSDGAAFVPQALAKGASAVLSDRALALGVPVLRVDDVRRRLGTLAHRIYGEPTRATKTFAVTGTNGKTTVTYLLEALLTHAGRTPALLGTIVNRGPAFARDAELTTPEADVIAQFARAQLDAGATHLVMEASSVALDQGRLGGVEFEVAAFTNLTQDHLDYHKTMEAYGEAKARLFKDYAPRHAVIMVDQPFGRALSESLAAGLSKQWRASLIADGDAELRVLRYTSSRQGIAATIATPHGEIAIQSPLFGAHNLENLLVTMGAALALGLTPDEIRAGLHDAAGAPGRMERVASASDVMVLVDYAHTPDAITRALSALRPLTGGRLFIVCGCGGDRDPKKRAPMGEAAARGADLALLTSDNPRTEDPARILAEMEVGAARAGLRIEDGALATSERGYAVIVDRAKAIQVAIQAARPGDTVLLAGKGHETYQIIGREKRDFDDREQAARALHVLLARGPARFDQRGEG
jgi:UDP-N-acetylmuramoyl-L-alanyl-D-glutamate--2,6-diaminopimelate ligase